MTIDDVKNYSDFFAENISDLPENVFGLLENSNNGVSDYLTPMELGAQWLFEFTKDSQPLTGSLLQSSELFIYGRQSERWDGTTPNNEYHIHLGAEINNQIVIIGRKSLGWNPDDGTYSETIARINANLTKTWGRPISKVERHLSLPTPISKAYYHRLDGLDIPLSPAVGIYSRLLPFPINRPWETIDSYLASLKLKSKLDLIHDWFPRCKPERKSAPYTNLMIFLDTRPALSGKEGDVFFVKNHIQDGTIYYIRDGNIDNLMVLNEPVEAIDKYCHHVLMRDERRFDFMPYVSKFSI
ncbi:hypothetical protein [Rheinheimera tangshanensis]|jgi:hypothetical protein|uniref:Uncharacterized protein n=1 Tax=Rheinheimera tangshanensis TaxID=400153 RepID=A0A5C8LMR9_9GAMM|nr:hypothetical protein [Rheinheimera tangshanensis]TXK76812.1 hypothetical protein FU839_18685 [Rheinheimera tangshanensis]GGM49745.1 hypothetical protein GCM10010920_07670 [Rheinheimera tangshanensis]